MPFSTGQLVLRTTLSMWAALRIPVERLLRCRKAFRFVDIFAIVWRILLLFWLLPWTTVREVMANEGSGRKVIAQLYVVTRKNLRTGVVKLELCFVGHDCKAIPPALGDGYGKKCRRLDLSFNALTSLQGLEKFVVLEELILDNNALDDTVMFPATERLTTVSLNKNKITDLERLIGILKERVPNLKYLSLLGNSACPHQVTHPDSDESDYQRYRYYILHQLPKLKFLDSRPVWNEERAQAKRIGHLARVVKPVMKPVVDRTLECMPYTPLPAGQPIGTHAGAFGTYRYKYTGRQSEGNRFILNQDL